jgi:ribonuclease PH
LVRSIVDIVYQFADKVIEFATGQQQAWLNVERRRTSRAVNDNRANQSTVVIATSAKKTQ